MEPLGLQASRKTVLVVLFVPSVERDGTTPIDQMYWVEAALDPFGQLLGGATAFPRAKGVWRDDERGGAGQGRTGCHPLLHDARRCRRLGSPRSTREFLPTNGPRRPPGRDRVGHRGTNTWRSEISRRKRS